ncbi:glycosyltransferase family 4 protein [Spiribacter onubensis]|uniref:Glycosyltransferase family 4 protein n=1 Tax=Spiribacter onubensis TaxID=3122420 RepID=A0ABV3SEF1_9GAMM
MKILILGSISRSLLNFRGPLIQRLRERGYNVTTYTVADENSSKVAETLKDWGVEYHTVDIARGGTNPLADIRTRLAIQGLLREARPDVLLAYTSKPVIYGGLAAQAVAGVRFFPMITGLGYAFTPAAGAKRRFLRFLLTQLYRRSLRGAERVIFQNPDDQAMFTELGLLPNPECAARVHGSGVDCEAFPSSPLPEAPVFLMLARLVADKGVREYVEAARRVRAVHPDARFRLAGGLDPNPASVSQAELDAWIAEGVIDYLGPVHPVQPELTNCRYYVLPSYREGTPRSVLEAMATGRPIITTDAPGCRETLEHGVNGLLVPPRDPDALASAMLELLSAPEKRSQSMADESLRMARERFDVHRVNDEILAVLGL